MATLDKTNGTGIPLSGTTSVYVIRNIIDLLLASAAGAAVVAADVIKALNIPAGSQILAYGVRCLRAPVGTTLVATFSGTSGTIAGTIAETIALGDLKPATLTAALLKDATALQLTMTTMTAITDPGKYEFYAVVADLN